MLEKHGYLSVEVAGPEALSDSETWSTYDVVLVPRLPHAAWTPEAISAVVDGTTPVFVEAPFPPKLRERLGVVASGGVAEDGSLVPVDAKLKSLCVDGFGDSGGGPV